MFRIFRGLANFDMMHLQAMRDAIKSSREVLASNPVPSTFLGQQTREPVALPEDPILRTDIHNLLISELQPPKE